ncbi:rCG22578 [Rattus norvegicus]|uniref:RCG22578 n=1 Tax=Rattus norvegicus TaxID=10116 RepID=A6IN80_RAT|nr:rCG22578 [Rattus norvegicus]
MYHILWCSRSQLQVSYRLCSEPVGVLKRP